MNWFAPDYLLYGSMITYLAAAIAAIIFYKHPHLCTQSAQAGCILASVLGAASAVRLLLSGQEKIILKPFESTIPYVSVSMTMDALSAFFLLILSVLTLCVSIYSIGYTAHYHGKRNVSLFHFLYSTFILSMLLVFTADNAVFFFMAWEIMAVLSYFLVVFESEQEENRQAGLLYIVMTHLGTAFLMIAFMLMFYYTETFDLSASSQHIPETGRNLMFLFFLIGFSTKAGVIPLHIWLPYAHPAAPGNISALMSGIMIKTAVYGLLRFVFLYLGVETPWWGAVILVIGMSSAVFGVLYAFIEQNIKKLLAYSSIENMGIIFIGLGIAFLAFARENHWVGALALTASLLHCFNHSLFKGGLFLGVGSIHYATHTKNMEKLGGLIKRMPVTAVFFLGSALSISALVPFNGFIGEWLTYQSIFASISSGNAALNIAYIVSVAVLALSGALAAACFIKLFGISFLGLPRSDHAAYAKEVPLAMNLGSGILAFLCLLFGLLPLIPLNLLSRVIASITGNGVVGQLQGGFLAAWYPLKISGNNNAVSPLLIFVSILLLAALALAMLRILGGSRRERKYGTWDCGFGSLTPRMQYSGTAFSKPMKIVFKIFFQSSRDLKLQGDHPYHPESMEYTITTESVFEKYIYIPLLVWVTAWSKRVKLMIQTGSVHTYLLYIFVAVLVLMLYNRIG
ncbi:MAG: hydrogenase 4 subunit B [Eubacteriales bacterium]|nr:hydrogenase 4 subunit B [Eubacteriales bacterium]